VIRRTVMSGLLAGLSLVLVALYPTFSLYIYPRILRMHWSYTSEPLRSLLLIPHGALAIMVLGLVGSLPAWRSNVSGAKQGFKIGAVSGLVVGVVFYILLLAPTSALTASARLWVYSPGSQAPVPPDPLIFRYIRHMTQVMHRQLLLCLVIGGLLGGIEGLLVGLLRHWTPPRRLSLLEAIYSPHPRRRWFADYDGTWQAGIVAGLIGGVATWLSLTVSFLSNVQTDWPELQAAISEHSGPLIRLLFNETLTGCIFPLLVLAVLGTSALAVLLLKDPPRRYLSRFQAVLIAGATASVPISLAVTNAAHFWSGAARYLALEFVQQARPLNPHGELVIDPEWLLLLRLFVRSPEPSLFLFYLLPLVLFAAILVVVVLWLTPQAAVYGLTIPLIFKRPVDRAARIARGVNNKPSSLLPQLYQLFATEAKAIKVLPHLAFLLKSQASAQLVAAYHTLGRGADGIGPAVGAVRRTLAEQPEWRWRAEVGELYRVLEEGLAAKTLAQVTAIEPPPEEITSSLPVLLAKSCEGIGRVLGELKKVERVDDLGTKIIFLNSAQAVLLDLHRYTERTSESGKSHDAPYVEVGALHTLSDRWQRFVLTATQDLQGRADLKATLLAHRLGFAERVRQCIVVSNQGPNVAQNVRLCVADGQGYRVVEGAEQQVDILSPQESRELEFWLRPEAPGRLRLAWQLAFDDAVDTGRRVEFADAMELIHEKAEQPFQRIFPIPYVTGTPLRSGEMFFGRQDVFDFVQEYLLGAYQNNVIVLHGQRRAGKTSILYRLREMLADTHVAVLIDMQGKAARGTADFLYALSDDIIYALENHSIFAELPERREYEDAPEFTFRSRFLRSIVSRLDNRNLLLMFDEFEELQQRVDDGRLEPEIFSFLRNLMQHEPRLDFLFSGTHKLEELGAEYWSILFNIAIYKRITFLEPDDVRHLVLDPVAPYGLEYDPQAVDRIIQVTAGHPYFVQVVCHEMVAYHNDTERNYLTATCVDQVLERIIERGEAHFKYIWAGAAPDEHRVMLALTDLLPDADATATPAQIMEELRRKGFTPSDDELKRALAHLQAKDIITRSGPQSRLYRFKIDLVRRWIGITRPALQDEMGD
jgi:hypothetical protein